jgi:hypothetical protein
VFYGSRNSIVAEVDFLFWFIFAKYGLMLLDGSFVAWLFFLGVDTILIS